MRLLNLINYKYYNICLTIRRKFYNKYSSLNARSINEDNINYYGVQRLIVKIRYMVGYILYRKGGKREVGYGRFNYIPDRRPGVPVTYGST